MAGPKIPKIPMPGNRFIGQQPSGQLQVGMNPKGFNELIASKGIRMVHARPLPCPNIKDLHASDHDPSCNQCQNGMIYYGHRELVGAFMGNDNNRQFLINGQWDLSNASIVMPTAYADGEDLDIQLFDQIIIPDFTVRYYQRVEHSQTGIDRLQFPAAKVDLIIDSTGASYTPEVDFTVDSFGNIKWLSQNRPGYDLSIDRGDIYSVNYYCKPVFTIIGLPHQLRTTQTIGPDGKPIQERFPQTAIVRKEFVPFNTGDKTGQSDAPEPRDGQF
jgi:hypothetical protein